MIAIDQRQRKPITDLQLGEWFCFDTGSIGRFVSLEPSKSGKTMAVTFDQWYEGRHRRLTWDRFKCDARVAPLRVVGA